MTTHMLEATGLVKSFPTGKNLFGRPTGITRALRGVDFKLDRGETLAIVGESGAGKSTVGRLALRLIEPDEGSVYLDGRDVTLLPRSELRTIRKRMQMIFQDPFSSLDPRMTIGGAVGEPLSIHFRLTSRERRERVASLLDRVGIASNHTDRYPHEFSGGQLQRIAIARALAVEPDVLVCDEPVAALDVSIRAEVINLLHDLQQERGVAYMFISHDLSLVRLIADRVAVMYQGKVVEEAESAKLFEHPRHPYTRALLDVVPKPDPRQRRRASANGPLAPIDQNELQTGCSYAPICPLRIDACLTQSPELRATPSGAKVSCHVAVDVDLAGSTGRP